MRLIEKGIYTRINCLLPPNCSLQSFKGRNNKQVLNAIGALRMAVWRATTADINMSPDQERWLDREDGEATHYAVFKDHRLIASTRLNVYAHFKDIPDCHWYADIADKVTMPLAVIARLVVDPEFKGQRIASFLDEECIGLALRSQARCLMCEVPNYRVNGLLRNGFEIVQPAKLGIKFPTITFTTVSLNLDGVSVA